MLNNKIFDKIIAYSFGVVLSMPLLSNWLGSIFTYLVYLISIFGSIYLFAKYKPNFTTLDIPFFLFIIAALLSVFSSISPNITTELLFLPLIISLYIGAKAIIISNLLEEVLTGMTTIFLIFSTYLMVQLFNFSFNYGLYYLNSNTSNKVEYLTMSIYAGIVMIYSFYKIKTLWIKYFLVIYTVFMIVVSGARFSIFFIVIFFLSIFIGRSRSIKYFFKILFSTLVILIVSVNLANSLDKKSLHKLESTFDFTYNRLSHFNASNNSLKGRVNAIDKSIVAINKKPFLGYGLNSSPEVINFIYPHNLFLEAWQDTGILGIFSLIILVICTLIALIKLFNNKSIHYLLIIYIYIFLSHLKSFSIFHSTLFFTFTSLILTYYILEVQNNKKGLK